MDSYSDTLLASDDMPYTDISILMQKLCFLNVLQSTNILLSSHCSRLPHVNT